MKYDSFNYASRHVIEFRESRVVIQSREPRPDIVAAVEMALRCRRFRAGDLGMSDQRWFPILDLIDESPTVAPYALVGFAESSIVVDRLLAANAAVYYVDRFPEVGRLVLANLIADPESAVRNAASEGLLIVEPR